MSIEMSLKNRARSSTERATCGEACRRPWNGGPGIWYCLSNPLSVGGTSSQSLGDALNSNKGIAIADVASVRPPGMRGPRGGSFFPLAKQVLSGRRAAPLAGRLGQTSPK
jgi:hypothetical protein